MDYYQPPLSEYVFFVAEKVNNAEDIKREVRAAYGTVAEANNNSECCGNGRSCCGVSVKPDESYSQELGYSKEEIANVPEGSNMGLGCGNPQTIASLELGEVVLDLGAGGGFDCFLAAKKVGATGKVFGVDMTPEMVSKARSNAVKNNYENVEFLLGEIEHLPLPDSTVDVIISNCVVNLATNKYKVFREAYRVLKANGRLAISDMVAFKPLPREMIENAELYCNCISGAATIDELKNILTEVGFTDIVIEPHENSRMFVKDWVPGWNAEDFVVSATIKALKTK